MLFVKVLRIERSKTVNYDKNSRSFCIGEKKQNVKQEMKNIRTRVRLSREENIACFEVITFEKDK